MQKDKLIDKPDILIDTLLPKIVSACDPDGVILFGSRAKGTNSPSSDIDLLIIKDSALPRQARVQPIKNLFYGLIVSVDILFYTPDEIEEEQAQPYSFINCVLRTGRVVYEKALFIHG